MTLPGLPSPRRGRHWPKKSPAPGQPTVSWRREPTGRSSVGLPRAQLPPGWTPAPEYRQTGVDAAGMPEIEPVTTGVEALQVDPIAAVQRRLLGSSIIAGRYPSLAVTGVLDGVTRAALAEFQHQVGIAVTGTIDRATEIALGAITGIPGVGANLPAPAQGRKIQLSRGWMAAITAVGMGLTVLMLLDGWGFVSGTARDIVAIVIAAATPIVVYFVPNWKPPGG